MMHPIARSFVNYMYISLVGMGSARNALLDDAESFVVEENIANNILEEHGGNTEMYFMKGIKEGTACENFCKVPEGHTKSFEPGQPTEVCVGRSQVTDVWDLWCVERPCIAIFGKCTELRTPQTLKDSYGQASPIAGDTLAMMRILQGPYGKGYVDSMRFFSTQGWATYCGLTSVTFALNMLEVPPEPFFAMFGLWTEESVLKECPAARSSINKEGELGLTGPELVQILDHFQPMLSATLYQATDPEKLDWLLLHHLKLASQMPQVYSVLVNYDRSSLGQPGSGHWSPLTGLDEMDNSTIIMDVARYKYGPQLVTISQIFGAMNTVDDNNQHRGWIFIEKKKRTAEKWSGAC